MAQRVACPGLRLQDEGQRIRAVVAEDEAVSALDSSVTTLVAKLLGVRSVCRLHSGCECAEMNHSLADGRARGTLNFT
jgi:hypothetical protein